MRYFIWDILKHIKFLTIIDIVFNFTIDFIHYDGYTNKISIMTTITTISTSIISISLNLQVTLYIIKNEA